ncbi:MAG: hypothetical protein K0Q73_2545, partial [Paenibacillus sp.]|nr:hypothetical protein [Paenibacillus sp.]
LGSLSVAQSLSALGSLSVAQSLSALGSLRVAQSLLFTSHEYVFVLDGFIVSHLCLFLNTYFYFCFKEKKSITDFKTNI